jgi:hypothetical protein
MTKISDILHDVLREVFITTTPCTSCRQAVPTYRDRETGRAYCLSCLEAAVTLSQSASRVCEARESQQVSPYCAARRY